MKWNRWIARATTLTVIGLTGGALAFCGFYVARADAKLLNKASQIIIAREGNRTVITMVSDFQGPVKDFAMVVPVPKVLARKEINVSDPSLIAKLDAYSAPRLVEYFDEDPCAPPMEPAQSVTPSATQAPPARSEARDQALGVKVEAQYNVGEYDIVILSAEQSDGLETWLKENNYNIPAGAREALEPYITAGMKFFVAKVNLQDYAKSGFAKLRPIRMSFGSEMFMLPLRLGMINSSGEQDLVVYALTRKGRVESRNYSTVKIPSNVEIPGFVKDEFGKFYESTFKQAHTREGKNAVFLEYAWQPSWCDPCAGEPPSTDDLRRAGAFWLADGSNEVFFTRLHLRYSKSTHPEDLMFKETSNQETFQGRYILRNPWKGEARCEAGQHYKRDLPRRLETQAQTLSSITGWDLGWIRGRMNLPR
jgi:hypothetical protein